MREALREALREAEMSSQSYQSKENELEEHCKSCDSKGRAERGRKEVEG